MTALKNALSHLEVVLGDVTHYVKGLPDEDRQALEEDGADEIGGALDAQRADVADGGSVEDSRDELEAALLALLLLAVKRGTESGVEDLADLDIDIDADPLTEASADWARKTAPKRAALINDTSRDRVAAALEAGLTGDALGAALDSIFGSDRALLIAVTEVTVALVAGLMLAYEAGEVKRVRWVTAADESVCPICAPLDGKTALVGEGFDGIAAPPAHPRCRCTLEPVV